MKNISMAVGTKESGKLSKKKVTWWNSDILRVPKNQWVSNQ